MTYIPAESAAHFNPPAGEQLRLGVFWRLGTDPALHIWMGLNDLPIGIPSVDPAGTIYLGVGRLLDLPELEVLLNGQADQVEFSLSGLADEHLAIIEESAPPVGGAVCQVGVAPLDSRWQPKTDIIPLWRGIADYVVNQMQPGSGENPAVKTISVVVGAGHTARARAKKSSWTSAFQRLLSPTDAFCDRVARYTQQYIVNWPRF